MWGEVQRLLVWAACVFNKSDPEVLISSSLTFRVSSVSMHEVVQQPFVKL